MSFLTELGEDESPSFFADLESVVAATPTTVVALLASGDFDGTSLLFDVASDDATLGSLTSLFSFSFVTDAVGLTLNRRDESASLSFAFSLPMTELMAFETEDLVM